MQLSSLYGANVSVKDGKNCGYILQVFAQNNCLCGFLCADKSEREFFISCKSFTFNGEFSVSAQGERTPKQGAPLRLGRPAYNTLGKCIGVLQEIYVREMRVARVKINGKTLPVDGVFLGEHAVTVAELRQDVTKDGKILFPKGAIPTEKQLAQALAQGEYVQTKLKRL